jgi:hypothetical protein
MIEYGLNIELNKENIMKSKVCVLRTSVLSIFFVLMTISGLAGWAGNADGGGGGTLPSETIDPQDVKYIVQRSLLELKLIVQGGSWFESYFQNKILYKKLYGGSPNLIDVLRTTKIEVRANRPCFDANKKPKDASIYADTPGAICLSAFRIGPKIVEETARKKIEGLILHELSHLLGANETEALEFQKEIESNWLRRSTEDSAQKYVQNIQDLFKKLQNSVTYYDPSRHTAEEVKHKLNDEMAFTFKDLSKIVYFHGVPAYSVMSVEDVAQYKFVQWQQDIMWSFVWTPTSLDRVFGGADKEEITFIEYMQLNYPGVTNELTNSELGNYPVKRPRNLRDLSPTFGSFASYFSKKVFELGMLKSSMYSSESVSESTELLSYQGE